MTRTIFILLLLGMVLIMSCSKSPSPTGGYDTGTRSLITTPPTADFLDESPFDLYRGLLSYDGEPEFTFTFAKVGPWASEVTLLDCISACYREYISGGTSSVPVYNYAYNYILVGDSKGRPLDHITDDFAIHRVKLYRMPKDADSFEDAEIQFNWGAYEKTYNKSGVDIYDPDGVALIPGHLNHRMYALVGDDYAEPVVKLFEITIDTDGTAHGPNFIRYYDLNLVSIKGVAGVLLDSTPTYRIFACDPKSNPPSVRIYDQSAQQNQVATLTLNGYRPMDVAVTFESTTSGKVYVAYQHLLNRHYDRVQVYSTDDWNSFTDEGQASTVGGSPLDFPSITAISVHEPGDHQSETVAIMALNMDTGWGYYLTQLNFGDANNPERATIDFVYESEVKPILPTGLAIGYNERGGAGYFYYVGDRDPDINLTAYGISVLYN